MNPQLNALQKLVNMLLGKRGVDYINTKKFGSRKTDFILLGLLILIGITIVYIIVIKIKVLLPYGT